MASSSPPTTSCSPRATCSPARAPAPSSTRPRSAPIDMSRPPTDALPPSSTSGRASPSSRRSRGRRGCGRRAPPCRRFPTATSATPTHLVCANCASPSPTTSGESAASSPTATRSSFATASRTGSASSPAQLLDSGHTMLAVEDPGHDWPRSELTWLGAKHQGVPVDGDGIVVEKLREDGRSRRPRHAGAPIPHRRRALAATSSRPHRLGAGRRRLRHRGRLRRRVPLRPAPSRGDAGPRSRSGDLLRDAFEEPGSRVAARLARAAGATRRADREEPDAHRSLDIGSRAGGVLPSSSATAISTVISGGCGGCTGNAATP